MDLTDLPLNFLDLETTGTSYTRDRIIEVYISKVINGEMVDSYHTVINPGFRPDPFILNLTNITLDELHDAPPFEAVVEDLFNFIDNEHIVAHNARFDHSFLKNEFLNQGYIFKSHHICTVKLSRLLYPQYSKHNLDSIIKRLELDDGERHRAEYDTKAIQAFFYKALEEHNEEAFTKALKKITSQVAVSSNLMNFDFASLANTPGVYIFKGDDDYPLYVGMSKHIKSRVLDHFYNNSKNEKEYKITSKAKSIEIIETQGELGAALRESHYIKSISPLYNRALRRKSALVTLKMKKNQDGYKTVSFERNSSGNVEEMESVIGIFGNKIMVKHLLQGLVDKHGLCPTLLSLESTKKACFSYHLGKCKGACVGQISAEEYNKIFDEVFSDYLIINWPFKSAIIVEEKRGRKVEKFLFDKWMFLGSNKGKGEKIKLSKAIFNQDTYKILKRYLQRKDANYYEVDLEDTNKSHFRQFL